MILMLLKRELPPADRMRMMTYWRLAIALLVLSEILWISIRLRLRMFLHDLGFWETWDNLTTLLIVQQFALIFGLMPILGTANLSLDKTNGVLIECMVTPMQPWEILFAKWYTLVISMLQLSLISLSISVLALGPDPVGWSMVVPMIWLPMVAAISVLASTWSRSFRSAMTLALIASAGLIAFVIDDVDGMDHMFNMVWMSAIGTLIILGLATLTFRRMILAHAVPAQPWTWGWQRHRGTVTDDPIRWQESGQAAMPMLRGIPRLVPPSIIGGLFFAGSLWTALDTPPRGTNGPAYGEHFSAVCILLSMVMMIVTATIGAMTVTTERGQRTWDSLYLTPLTGREILMGKIWGILDRMRPVVIAYMIPSLLVTIVLDPRHFTKLLSAVAAVSASIYWATTSGVRSSIAWTNGPAAIGIALFVGFVKVFFIFNCFFMVAFGLAHIDPFNDHELWMIIVVAFINGLATTAFILDARRQQNAAARLLDQWRQPIAPRQAPDIGGADLRFSSDVNLRSQPKTRR